MKNMATFIRERNLFLSFYKKTFRKLNRSRKYSLDENKGFTLLGVAHS